MSTETMGTQTVIGDTREGVYPDGWLEDSILIGILPYFWDKVRRAVFAKIVKREMCALCVESPCPL